MSDNEMLYCLVAFILGWLTSRMMGNGFSIGGDKKLEGRCIPDPVVFDKMPYKTTKQKDAMFEACSQYTQASWDKDNNNWTCSMGDSETWGKWCKYVSPEEQIAEKKENV